MDSVVVITGPTASGKTTISIALSELIGGEIINCDSIQIYKRCNIGSAKPTVDERAKIPHHLIDILEPQDNFSAAEYKEKAVDCIREIVKRGKVPVITGGTGLYIDSLIKNIDFSVDKGNPELRSQLNAIAKTEGPEFLYDKLVARDPEAALTVHQNNTRRVVRYLEILDGFDGTLSEYMQRTRKRPGEFEYLIYVLWPDRESVYKRIESRVDEMLEDGLVDEVRALMEEGIDSSLQCMTGIGYKETYSYLTGHLSYDEFVELLKRNTRRYAKRQFTWFKRLDNAVFIQIDSKSDVKAIARVIASAYLDHIN